MYGCFIDDEFGSKHLDDIGLDNVMMECDYPHGDSTYPNTEANSAKLLADYSPDIQYQVRQGNARRVFKLDEEL
jgi:predicted TIM-barrel fold metal-dependent hydrolase